MAKIKLPYRDVIEITLNKERDFKKACKATGLNAEHDSALDISYCNEILSLLNLPDEKDLSLYRTSLKNYDPIIDDYTFMIYGDKKIKETLDLWEKKMASLIKPYEPKNNIEQILKFIQQEKKLVKALRTLGVSDSGPLANLISDYKLACALIGQNEEKIYQDLFYVLEGNESEKKFLKKYIS